MSAAMQILKNVLQLFFVGVYTSTHDLQRSSTTHILTIYLLLGSPVTGNCSSGRLYAVQFQEIPGIQHVDGCFPIQVTMVRVRVGRLFKVKCTWSTVCMYILHTKYVRVEEWICTCSKVYIYVHVVYSRPKCLTFSWLFKRFWYFTSSWKISKSWKR